MIKVGYVKKGSKTAFKTYTSEGRALAAMVQFLKRDDSLFLTINGNAIHSQEQLEDNAGTIFDPDYWKQEK